MQWFIRNLDVLESTPRTHVLPVFLHMHVTIVVFTHSKYHGLGDIYCTHAARHEAALAAALVAVIPAV